MFDTDDIISLVIVAVSWLLVFFLLTAKTKNRTSNILLSLFLIVNAQDSSGMIAHFLIYPKYPGLGMLFNSSVFFKMPLIFLYILSVIYSDFKLQKKHIIHLLPWLLNILVLVPRYFGVDFDSKWSFLNANAIERMPEVKFSYFLVHFQILIYLIMSFVVIKRYKTLLLENYSNANLFNHKWLFQFMTLFAIEAFIATLKNVFMFMHLETIYFYTQLVTATVALAFICWIVLKALHNPELFRGINSNLQLVKDLIEEKGIKRENDVEESLEITKLKEYMSKEEPYLNASLTMYDLSKQMNIPSKDLSLLINHNLNQHFFDFVNRYRIEKAKELLISEERKNHTILEILYEVGFNTKSSFNTAFKKHTQVTPTFYRKNTIKKAS